MPSKYAPTRQRKHKRARAQTEASTASSDTNAPIILPPRIAPATTLENDDKGSTEKPTGKKQKRLEKYLANKLKKDEAMGYLKLLEAQKAKDDEVKTKEDSETTDTTHLRKRKREEISDMNSKKVRLVQENVGEDGSEDEWEAEHPEAFEEAANENLEANRPSETTVQLGSGLSKPLLLGENGLPVLETRKKNRKRKRQACTEPEPTDETWNGFSEDEAERKPTVDKIALIKALVEDVEDYGYSDEDAPERGDGLEGEDDENDTASTSDASEFASSSTTSDTSAEGNGKPKTSAFKAWATQQVNQSLGHTPSYDQPQAQMPSSPETINREPPVTQANGEDITQKSNRKIYTVHVNRSPDIQASRSELPLLAREQEIMEAIHSNPVVIIKGDTGSGKTTQVPQILYEAGYGSREGPMPGMIGITQPRRIAATTIAERVADEMGDHGYRVAHQIRYESSVTRDTAVKFMTDGILLRELEQDLLLRKYSVLVIDEAHERSVNTDVLIGILSKVVPARLRKNQWNPDPKPLKVIIMSATLNIEDFLDDRLFKQGEKPPIVEIEGRQHRVTTHFALRSRADYVDEVVEKVRKGHRKLPKGGILVFLTGQNEIRHVGQRLQQLLVKSSRTIDFMNGTRVQLATAETPLELEDMEIENPKQMEDAQDDYDEVEIIANNSDDDEAEEREFDISDDDSTQLPTTPKPTKVSKEPYTSVHILPLYAQLPKREQNRVFEPAPAGHRLIVLATNVAETSITIPGIRYVFDAGRAKGRKFDRDSGVQSFEIDYISKASAAQRAGRAGRTGPGHCWRLYTSAVYEQFFAEHSEPQITTEPAESVVLALKNFKYPKPVQEFPFPSIPSLEALSMAETLLKNLGALTPSGEITELGKELNLYPLSPRLAKIMAGGVQRPDLIQHVIALVAGLAVQEIFVTEAALDFNAQNRNEDDVYKRHDQLEDEERDKRKQAFGRARAIFARQDKTSDAIKILTAVSMYNASGDKDGFCRDYFLRPKAMAQVTELQRQLIRIVKSNNPTLAHALTQNMKTGAKELKQLSAVCASGYIDQVAIRSDLSPNPPEVSQKLRRAIDVPYLPLIPLTDKGSAPLMEKAVFIHPSSALAKQSVKDLPKFIIYSHLQKSQSRSIGGDVPKTRMFPLTAVDSLTLVQLAKDTALLEYGKPVPGMKIEEIRGVPKRRECFVSTELRAGSRGFGWPLASIKVLQVMDVKSASGWRTEQILQ